MPPIHIPLRLLAAILSRMRSPVTSRSNSAHDSSTLSIKRPMDADAPARGQLFLIEVCDFHLGLRANELAGAHERFDPRTSQVTRGLLAQFLEPHHNGCKWV